MMRRRIATLAAAALVLAGCIDVTGQGYSNPNNCYGQNWMAQGWVSADTDGGDWRIVSATGFWSNAAGVPSVWTHDNGRVYFSKWTTINGSVYGWVTVQDGFGGTDQVAISATKPC